MKMIQVLFPLIGIMSVVMAQEPSKLVPPPGPLILLRAPDFAQWVVTLKSTSDQSNALTGSNTDTSGDPAANSSSGSGAETKPKPSYGVVVTTTKTGTIIMRKTEDDKGQFWATWCVGGLQITLWPDSQKWIVQGGSNVPGSLNPNFVDYSQSDYPGFEWISLASYVGIQSHDAKSCLAFKGFTTLPGMRQPSPVTAYVDLKTRLPVSLNISGQVFAYEFLAPPQTMLAPPDIISQLVAARQKMNNSAIRKM